MQDDGVLRGIMVTPTLRFWGGGAGILDEAQHLLYVQPLDIRFFIILSVAGRAPWPAGSNLGLDVGKPFLKILFKPRLFNS